MIIAVIIPCFKVTEHIQDVISRIPPSVSAIYCIDDACPESSGFYIQEVCTDKRVKVLFHERNQGVGGAVLTGYKAALADGAEILVKIDGDGQMDPALLPLFTDPIEKGICDYAKGNRFYRPEDVEDMPAIRLFGNAALSFLTKLSSGYWQVFDPTNGYTAIHSAVACEIPFEKVSLNFFFESDMLFRLNIIDAVVYDVPMKAQYGDEKSNLKIGRIIFDFLGRHIRNFGKRVIYNYFLRDFNMASLELLLSVPLLVFGITFGLSQWHRSVDLGTPASAGTVMLSALPILLGFQMLLSFLQYDISTSPSSPIHKKLKETLLVSD